MEDNAHYFHARDWRNCDCNGCASKRDRMTESKAVAQAVSFQDEGMTSQLERLVSVQVAD